MTVPAPPPEPSPADIQAQYGFVAMLAQAVPEIGRLMQRAVKEKWTAERFQMAVASTSWWKATPAPTRQWVTQQASDPATARRSMATGGDEVIQRAASYGFQGISAEKAQQIWLTGQLRGYDDTMMDTWVFNAIFKHGLAGEPNVQGGELGTRISEAAELAAAYGYNPRDLDAQIRNAAGASISSSQNRETGLQAWQDKLKSYAKSKYAAFADRFDQGETVMDIAQPYIEMYSQTLELNPQDVALDDKHLQRWLQGQSQAGKPPASVPVWQAQQELRKDERWGYTQNARQAAAEAATVIGKAFGMIG